MPASTQQGDWPLVVAADLCRRRQPLYEAILRLERDGAAVIERPLADAAVVLSAGTCIVLHDEADFQVRPQSFAAPLLTFIATDVLLNTPLLLLRLPCTSQHRRCRAHTFTSSGAFTLRSRCCCPALCSKADPAA